MIKALMVVLMLQSSIGTFVVSSITPVEFTTYEECMTTAQAYNKILAEKIKLEAIDLSVAACIPANE